MADEKKTERKAAAGVDSKIAKKDFLIVHNNFRLQIKAGDDLSDLPEVYVPNMKTEGVL